MPINRLRIALLAGGVAGICMASTAAAAGPEHFERVATYPVFLNLPDGVDPTTETVAHSIAATRNGRTLIYADGARGTLGFVDITNPASPSGDGTVDVGGMPTEIAAGRTRIYAGVDTSDVTGGPSGHVAVIASPTRTILATCPVDGRPAGVAISPNGRFLAVAVEKPGGAATADLLAPASAGHLAIFRLRARGIPRNCDRATVVDLAGLAQIAPADPDPQGVDINRHNFAVVTLQTNNHVVLVDLARAAVAAHFPAGAVDLAAVDVDADGIIAGTGSLQDVAREPDGAGWIGNGGFVTANEGAEEGGSRGFSIFDTRGRILFDSAETMEHLAMSIGHYLEPQAAGRGVEPEAVEVARYGRETLVFVSSASGNFVAVFTDGGRRHDDDDHDDDDDFDRRGRDSDLALLDVLPTAISPEDLLAIPRRDLFVVATDRDVEDDNLRSTISIYARAAEDPVYPMIVSDTDLDTGAPIGWGALSGLVADPDEPDLAYAVNDSFYDASRIYTLDVGEQPARIVDFVDLTLDGVLQGYDLEGIALRPGGGFWAVSEGRLDRGRNNLLLQVAADGTVEAEIKLPAALEETFWVRFGFEGVATWGDKVIVAIQREWRDDPDDQVKLAVYDPSSGAWTFARYPLDPPSSPRGGWVGLSEITALGGDRFLIIERDNQSGPASTRKVVTEISLDGVEPAPFGGSLPLVEKTVVVDLLPLMRAGNGWISDKPEGLAVTADGRVLMVTDNDGVEDANGETQLLTVGHVGDLM